MCVCLILHPIPSCATALRHIYSHHHRLTVRNICTFIFSCSYPLFSPSPFSHRTHTSKSRHTNSHLTHATTARTRIYTLRQHTATDKTHTAQAQTHSASPRQHSEHDATKPNDEIYAAAGPGSGRFVWPGRPPAMDNPRLSDSSFFIFLPSQSRASQSKKRSCTGSFVSREH